MSNEASDPRLGEIIARYLQDAEAGSPPEQAELIAAHPELAERLKWFFAHFKGPRATTTDATIPLGAPDIEATLPPPSLGFAEATVAFTGKSRGSGPQGSFPRIFDDYELLEEVARGGMGVVYRARQASLNRIVALKMILAGHLASDEDVQRFHAEAEAAANLDHPGIVPIYEIGEYQGQHYFSMGYVEGESLADKTQQGPLPHDVAAELARKIAEAIRFAHQNGVIHRDLKPANVLLDRNGEPRVTDFGLAKRVEGDSGLTATGQILGTPSYMAPEQAAGKIEEVGPLADVYALGAILYCLLTGRPPFQSANTFDTLMQVLNHEPVPPGQLNAGVPVDLATISLKCLEKEPGRRYQSADEFVAEMDRFCSGKPILARPVKPLERALKWMRRRPGISAALGIAATAVLILLVAWGLFTVRLQDQTDLAVARTRLANERLFDSSLEQARAHRAAGDRSASLATITLALRQLDKLETTQDKSKYRNGFRREAIETLSISGLELVHEIPFGEVRYMRISPDSRFLAVHGNHAFSPPGEKDDRGMLIVYDLASGRKLGEKRLPRLNSSTSQLFHFRHPLRLDHNLSFAFQPSKEASIVIAPKSDAPPRRWTWDGDHPQTTWDLKPPIVISPDGKAIAGMRLNKQLTRVLTLPQGESAGPSIRGQPLLFRGSDELIVFADFRLRRVHWGTGETLSVTPAEYAAVAMDPTGRFCVLREANNENSRTAVLWDLQKNNRLHVFQNIEWGTSSISTVFSSDGLRLALPTSETAHLQVWDIRKGNVQAVLPGYRMAAEFNMETEYHIASFSPDNRMLAMFPVRQTSSSAESAVRLWDLATQRSTVTKWNHWAPRWSGDGQWLVTLRHGRIAESAKPSFSSSRSTHISIWRVNRPSPAVRIGAAIRHLRFDPSGSRLISNNRLWSFAAAPNLMLRREEVKVPANSLHFTQSGELAAIELPPKTWNAKTSRWSVRPPPLVRWPGKGRNATSLDLFDVPHKQAVTSEVKADLSRQEFEFLENHFALARGREVLYGLVSRVTRQSASGTVASSFSADQGPVVWSLKGDPGAVVWEQVTLRGGERRQRPHLQHSPECVAISPDESLVAVGGQSLVTVLDLKTGREVGRLPCRLPSTERQISVHDIVFSHDSRHFYAATGGGRIWHATRNAGHVGVLTGHDGDVRAVAAHPSGGVLASGGGDHTIRLWDVRSQGAEPQLAVFTGHLAAVTALEFHPSGDYLVSGAEDGSIKVWDLRKLRAGLKKLGLAWREPARQ